MSDNKINVPDLNPLFFFQESFTVTLGAQMKQMHNLRIVAANIMGKQHSHGPYSFSQCCGSGIQDPGSGAFLTLDPDPE